MAPWNGPNEPRKLLQWLCLDDSNIKDTLCVTLYTAKAAYNHRTFPPTISWLCVCVCLSVCLSVQCIVAKRLIGYGCGLGW